MTYLAILFIAACVFIMYKYHTIRTQYLLASLFLVSTNALAIFHNHFSFFDGQYFDDKEHLLFTGYIAAACFYIAKSKGFQRSYAYTVLCIIYFFYAFEDMIIDHGLFDSIYYPVMYGGTLFLVGTVVYDRLAPIKRLCTDYVRKFGTTRHRLRRSSQ